MIVFVIGFIIGAIAGIYGALYFMEANYDFDGKE